ncbi:MULTISPECIES: O-antigen ligase family protein [unclassified Microbacterium]|uniref:O-antigen ligase family protein n=1 Tax=unclassified Microbacterium TaxID=2609290 RepID=UPI003867DDA8
MSAIARLSENAPPLAAGARAGGSRRGWDASAMLTVYLVLLLGVPSNLTVGALAAIGRPSLLWGLLLFAWWGLSRLQPPSLDVRRIAQPVRLAMGAMIVIALVSLTAALLRGQPADQISPAITAVLRLLSWAGVALVAMDGLRTMHEVSRMIRRLVIAGGALAALGIAQFVTGQTLLDVFSVIPGLSLEQGGVDARGAFTRSSGTATHPLEYATALSAILPLALATAISRGFRRTGGGGVLRWWIPVALIGLSSLLAVSRSAIIGMVVAVVATIPGIPRRFRALVVVGGTALAGVAVVAVPGLFGTMVGLFAGIGNDSSTSSRVDGLDRAGEFISTSPLVGNGFGIFLPRYYIFDNQWALLAVELGVLGVLAFAAVLGSGVWSAWHAGKVSGQDDVFLAGRALTASLITIGVLYAFFDGLQFPIAAGLPFLLIGLCCALRTVGETDARLAESLQRTASRGED